MLLIPNLQNKFVWEGETNKTGEAVTSHYVDQFSVDAMIYRNVPSTREPGNMVNKANLVKVRDAAPKIDSKEYNQILKEFEPVCQTEFPAESPNGYNYAYVTCGSGTSRSCPPIYYINPYVATFNQQYVPYQGQVNAEQFLTKITNIPTQTLSPIYSTNVQPISVEAVTTGYYIDPRDFDRSICGRSEVANYENVFERLEDGAIVAPTNYSQLSPIYSGNSISSTNRMDVPPPSLVPELQLVPINSSSFYRRTSVAPSMLYTGSPQLAPHNAPLLVTPVFPQMNEPNQIVLPISSRTSPPSVALSRNHTVDGDSTNFVSNGQVNSSNVNGCIKDTEQELLEFVSSVNSSNMHIVWHSIFERYFNNFKVSGYVWDLKPCENIKDQRFKYTVKDSAKVRFLCRGCGNAWTSMKGRILFAYELNHQTRAGSVIFQLFGQQCDKCKNGSFEHAMWYPEEVHKVLSNIYNHVGERYYSFPRKIVRTDRRPGKPRTAHNSKLCQACTIGCCYENPSFNKPIVCY